MSEKVLNGIGVSGGIRIGEAYVWNNTPVYDSDRNISEENADEEAARFKKAAEKALQDVEKLISDSAQKLGEDKIGILKGQKGILTDPAYCPEIEKKIRRNFFSAEKAVEAVTEKFAKLFESMKNDYMKERSADVRDAGNRLLNVLSGRQTSSLSQLSSPVILIAEDLTPSDTIQLDKNQVLAFATQRGGKTSHTSIFAKSMGIPAVVGVCGLLQSVPDGTKMIIDGETGACIIDPLSATLRAYEEMMKAEAAEESRLRAYRGQNAVTRDGKRITVAANIGSYADVDFSLRQGAEAVGLFRTEQIYISRESLPDEEEQFEEYRKIAQAYSEKQVIIRTLDIGGDKSVKYMNIQKEENPFLGYRAIRLCLDRKELFLSQLRAILRAGVYGNLAVMFPMISGLDELLSAKAVLEEAKNQLREKNIPYSKDIKVGIMVEIPSAAVMADMLAKHMDFFSIGTNDLVQYSLAVDRGNEKVAYLYDYFNPAVIRLIKFVTDAAHANNIPVGMCGGMAGDPLAAPLLIGLNLDELSMAAGAIAKVKSVICNVDAQECRRIAESALGKTSSAEIREMLSGFAG